MNISAHIEIEDLAMYALRALVDPEAVAITHHLRSCDSCRGQVAEVREHLGVYAQLTPELQVPDRCRSRFLSHLAGEKKLVPWPIECASREGNEAAARKARAGKAAPTSASIGRLPR